MKRFICILISVLFACSVFAQKGLIVNDIPIYSTDVIKPFMERTNYYRVNVQKVVKNRTYDTTITIQDKQFIEHQRHIIFEIEYEWSKKYNLPIYIDPSVKILDTIVKEYRSGRYGIYRNDKLLLDSITKSEAIKIQQLMVLQQKETDSLLAKANAEIETMRKKNELFLRNKIIVEGKVSSHNYGVYPSMELSAKVPTNIKTRAKRVTFTVKFYNNINECTATRTASTTGFTDAGRWMYGEFNAYNVDCADADHIKIIRVDMQLENGQHLTQFIDEKKAPNDEEESEKILAKYCNSIETAWGKEIKRMKILGRHCVLNPIKFAE